MGDVPLDGGDRRSNRHRFAVGRIEDEFGPIDVDADVAHVERNPFEDLGQGVGSDRNLSRFGIDEEARTDDDGAKVEGPSLGRRDHND